MGGWGAYLTVAHTGPEMMHGGVVRLCTLKRPVRLTDWSLRAPTVMSAQRQNPLCPCLVRM